MIFVDREGRRENLRPRQGESVYSLLVRHFIPPTSVVVLQDKVPVTENIIPQSGYTYEVHLIEGYDVNALRSAYREMTSSPPTGELPCFTERHLSFGLNGALQLKTKAIDLERLAVEIEGRVAETIDHFKLVHSGDKLVLGLSGGVDSSSLLLILASAAERIGFEIQAVTFEDFDSKSSTTFCHAHQLAESLGVPHNLVPARLVEETFHLGKSLRDILVELMSTPSAHLTMYIDHHTTRRALEVFAENCGVRTIALGLHTTDLIAGLLNGWTTGYYVADLPKRPVGNLTYIYPLAFVSKKELHLYHLQKTGQLANHSHPNPWELVPKDRNYYYYLADELQRLWPGIEDMLFTAHNWRVKKDRPPKHETCANCGSSILSQPGAKYEPAFCDVCLTFRAHGYLLSGYG